MYDVQKNWPKADPPTPTLIRAQNIFVELICRTICRNLFSQAFAPIKYCYEKVNLSHFPQSSLSAEFLSASIRADCSNSSEVFMIRRVLSSMGSSQRVMKSMSNFNTRIVLVIRHIEKVWLKKTLTLMRLGFLRVVFSSGGSQFDAPCMFQEELI